MPNTEDICEMNLNGSKIKPMNSTQRPGWPTIFRFTAVRAPFLQINGFSLTCDNIILIPQGLRMRHNRVNHQLLRRYKI